MKKEICKYCVKCNNDHADDENERYDFYSCDYMNDRDIKECGCCSSDERVVYEDYCKYPGCDTCRYKVEIQIDKLESNWNKLKKWLENDIEKTGYKWGGNINRNNHLGLIDIEMRIRNFSEILNKMQELENKND